MREHGPWQIRNTRQVYRDPWVRLTVDDVVRPDGTPGTFNVIHIKPGVSVLAMDDAGFVYLTEEFRYAVGRPSLEVVSGGVEDGEEPLAAARRELKEELGIEAGEWTDLGQVDPFTSMVLSPARLFLARQLQFGEHERDGSEVIRCVPLPLAEAVQAVLDSRITHSPSCLAILKAAWRVQHPSDQ
jgi:8-oxo-dGTP pyrophosphatase MutT (NUDIX family)